MTVADFVQTRFLPGLVATKTFAGRAHYHSILKHLLTPEEMGRYFRLPAENPNGMIAGRPGWPYIGNLCLRDVRPHHVQQLLATALANGYSPQTVRHIRSVISAIFSYAKQELVYMGVNPASFAKAPELVPKTTLLPTLSEVEQIIRAMRYPEKEMTLFALLTEMNLSEICGLQWKYVNLTGAWLKCDEEPISPLTIAVRKRWYRGELADAKDTRRRQIPIPETLLPMLLLLKDRTSYRGADDFVLTSRSGAAINVANITARRLGVIGKRLEMPELTWQVLRRAQSAMKQTYGPQFQYHIAAAHYRCKQASSSTPD